MLPFEHYLPEDYHQAILIGRVWEPAQGEKPAGPIPILIVDDKVFDISGLYPTVAHIFASSNYKETLAALHGAPALCSIAELIEMSLSAGGRGDKRHLLAPVDLQPVKACGVTFASSMIERVIEEKAAGDFEKAAAIRDELQDAIGGSLANIEPGSEAAAKLKVALIEAGYWSQYLEVGIGPDAEVFSKASVLSSVGLGAEIGLHPKSEWNNPEPEIVLIVDPEQNIVGVTLGNDVNLRDIEGRSALLLGKAKDNNASCSLGPFIRLLDDNFTKDDVRNAVLSLKIEGPDGYVLDGKSSMAEISRDIEDLVRQASGATHQYPDGFALMTGTLFAPTDDRDTKDMGFTHKLEDVVRISTQKLGTLENQVTLSDKAPPWRFGIMALIASLRERNLI
ncbi:fumarylacetoacetate hydrolase family protein [Kordiimonas sp. SCSIO 12610]|uniref:fumarylacetoacetate hydrolase family protein n=1 Tax=Kordiimonas sp. SCSIO 12610 TaxID=2829597 RepID=UPI00210BCBDE|nr:fumarylacetoacetate hydrolase family protein [Kordiimonas sp. SCSIO 12610]UTW54685.1 fumarylacetoacetate hydrolase family protein [Kordiimonas sp. SCSIO 12610]